MNKISFSDLRLTPKVERAIEAMGFDFATPIQSESIPVIRTGVDVIAKSQTGTGKTVAFSIPAIERVDTHQTKPTIQVLILCPTRELAQQAYDELSKLARFKTGIVPAAIYGGVPIDKQCIRLRKANIVVGTPGRVMDHMRRKSIKLNDLKMIILDEADEMLSMGFQEDIETILTDTPEQRQTVLFSATMPPSIMALTKKFQKEPKLIEINKSEQTIKDIEQFYIDVNHQNKIDALNLLLKFYQPKRAIVFCNTKKMTDKINEYLCSNNYTSEALHSDVKQGQRTTIMHNFKSGRTQILIATDIAARGIDVNDVDYVINYDVPQNLEYYIHRIGRTGRAGKSGKSITICTGRREVFAMRDIARTIKSDVTLLKLPSSDDVKLACVSKITDEVEKILSNETDVVFTKMVSDLCDKGFTAENIAAAVLELHFGNIATIDEPVQSERQSKSISYTGDHDLIRLDIGKKFRVAPNHVIGMLTEKTALTGGDIGKVNVYSDYTIVEIPKGRTEEVLETTRECKICGRTCHASEYSKEPPKQNRSSSRSRNSSQRRGRPSYGRNSAKR